MEKRFCLVKTYPGSPKLGTIVDRRGSFVYFDVNSPNINNTISQNYVENYPEFWQEVIEKKYEILSFIYNGTHSVKEGTIVKMKNGKLDSEHQNLDESHYLTSKVWFIHSIKRLSDGEIFTIGDRIKGFKADEEGFKIKYIFISKNELCFTTYSKNETFSNSRSCYLNNTYPIKLKTPLFKTEDNVDIYKGMNYFTVYKDKSSNTWTTQNNPFVADDDINFHIHNDVKYFSTKENAISYIIYNKPCLSVNDLLGVLGGTQNIDSLMKKIKHTI